MANLLNNKTGLGGTPSNNSYLNKTYLESLGDKSVKLYKSIDQTAVVSNVTSQSPLAVPNIIPLMSPNPLELPLLYSTASLTIGVKNIGNMTSFGPITVRVINGTSSNYTSSLISTGSWYLSSSISGSDYYSSKTNVVISPNDINNLVIKYTRLTPNEFSFSITSRILSGSGGQADNTTGKIDSVVVNAGNSNGPQAYIALSASSSTAISATTVATAATLSLVSIPINTPTIYFWTKESGSGGIITTPTASSTTITNLSAGSYVFKLAVSKSIDGIIYSSSTDLIVIASSSAAPIYYVKNGGNDSLSGTSEATAWASHTKVSSSMASGVINAGSVILYKRGDIFTGSLNITRTGTLAKPITFGSYGFGYDPNPLFTGLSVVNSWRLAGVNLWESNLPVSNLSTLKMVTINGINTPMGKYPAPGGTGYSLPQSWHPTPGNNGWLNYESNSGPGDTQTITDNQLTGTPNWTGAELVVKKVNWVVDHGPILSHSGNTLTYSGSMPDDAGNSDAYGAMSYFIQNDLRCCTYQNAWYYSPSTKKITIYSVGAPTNVKVATVQNLIKRNATAGTDDNAYINFNSIDFEGSNDDAVFLKGNVGGNTIGWSFRNCNFSYIGRDAVYCHDSATTFTFNDNTITDTNNNGVYCGSSSSNVVMLRNTLSRIGMNIGMTDQSKDKENTSAEGLHAHCTYTPYTCTITNNRIIDVGYNGISFFGSNALVNKNYIKNFNVVKSDGGAIYTWNDNGSGHNTNRIIEDNIIISGSLLSTIGSYGETTEPSVNGIYLDGGTDSTIVRRNTIANVNASGIYMNTPMSVEVSNNTIYDCRFASIHVNRDATSVSNHGDTVLAFTMSRNICVAKTLNQPQGNSFAYTMNQRCFYYLSTSNDMVANMTSSNNIMSRPLDENTADPLSRVVYTSYGGDGIPQTETKYTLSNWKSTFALDSGSQKGPLQVSSDSKIRFEYNDNTYPISVDLGSNTYMDISGSLKTGSITIQPFESKILLNTL